MPAKLGADSSSPGCNPLLAQEFACLLVGFLAKNLLVLQQFFV
jgi:hypothetical protein